MSWARVDDGWWCHPKVMCLSLEARGLWVSALSWSCAQRRDVVPSRLLMMLDASVDLAGELVAAGMWIECDEGWRIHDWGDYQERSLSEKRAEAGRKGGQAKAAASKELANAGKPDLLRVANGLAGPSRPVPSLPEDHPPHDPSVDNVLGLIVSWRTKQAQAAGKVKNPTAYARTVAADVETLRPKVTEALERFDANPHAIAEYIEGKRSARYLTRRKAAG